MKKAAKRMSLVLALCLLCSAMFSAVSAGAAPLLGGSPTPKASGNTPDVFQGKFHDTVTIGDFTVDADFECLGTTPDGRKIFFDFKITTTAAFQYDGYDFEMWFGKENSDILMATDVRLRNGSMYYRINPTYETRDRVDTMAYYYKLPCHLNGESVTEYRISGEYNVHVRGWNYPSKIGFQLPGGSHVWAL